MDKIELLDATNYPISEKRCWDEGVGFYERKEKGHPFDFPSSPPVVSAIGMMEYPDLAIITDRGDEDERRCAWLLGLECALNAIPFATNYSAKGLERYLADGAAEGDGKVMLLLPGGMECFLDNRKRLSSILLAGGSIVSPFRTASKIGYANLLYNRTLVERVRYTILIRTGRSEFNHAVSVLDRGGMLFLHPLALKDRWGQLLAKEGAPLLYSVTELMERPVGFLYSDENGPFQYDKNHSYSFLKL